ncbi:MAG: Gfo/Idh/MocA family oxidoreductase [Tissierellia bacterium]|nr:Gfo/Idh/MocA family oxidoreductase [Tissierellia bacterium]
MKKVRFGLIGCGSIGRVHADIIKGLAHAELVAIAGRGDHHREFAEDLSCDFCLDYEDLLNNPEIDAVAICLPSGAHSRAAIQAARAGKHVICEKPIATTLEEGQAMIDAARDKEVELAVIFQHRFDKPIVLLKQAIEEGKLGKLLWGSSKTIWYRDDKYFSNPWRGTWEHDGGGALINQSIHYIDLLIHLFGDVKSLSGKCRTLRHKEIETEDIGVANLEFTSGAIGTIEGTTASYPGLYAELSVFGEKGSVIIRNDQLLFYHFEGGKWQEFEKILDPEKANALNTGPEVDRASHIRQYEDFINAILEKRRPLVTGEEAIKSLEVIKAIYRASDTKKEVYL